MVVNGAGNVVFLFVEEQTVKGVDVQFVGIGVVGIKNGVTKGKKTCRFVEVRAKNGVTIARIIICHKFHLYNIVACFERII